MGSWLTCHCGALLHTNMFSGTGISVLATEEFLDAPRTDNNLDGFVTELIAGAPKLLTCKSCGRIVVLTYRGGIAQARSYVPEPETETGESPTT